MKKEDGRSRQYATRDTQYGAIANRKSQIANPLVLGLLVLLCPGLHGQADGINVAIRDVAVGLLAAGKNAEGRMQRPATRNTHHATPLTFHFSRLTLRPLVVEKIP